MLSVSVIFVTSIVAYVAHFMNRRTLCVVMEYCPGGDLSSLLENLDSSLPEPVFSSPIFSIVLHFIEWAGHSHLVLSNGSCITTLSLIESFAS